MMLHMWMTYNNMRQPWYLVMLCNTRIIDDYLVIIILVFDLTIMWVSSIVTYVSNYHVCTLNFHIDKQCVMLVKILILTKMVIFSYFQFQEITISDTKMVVYLKTISLSPTKKWIWVGCLLPYGSKLTLLISFFFWSDRKLLWWYFI